MGVWIDAFHQKTCGASSRCKAYLNPSWLYYMMSASRGARISRSCSEAYARIDGGSVMEFDALLAQVLDLLQRDGRVSYRALKLRFQLNDEYIEALKDEIIEVKRQAIDRDGRVLVWIGDPSPALAPG